MSLAHSMTRTPLLQNLMTRSLCPDACEGLLAWFLTGPEIHVPSIGLCLSRCHTLAAGHQSDVSARLLELVPDTNGPQSPRLVLGSIDSVGYLASLPEFADDSTFPSC